MTKEVVLALGGGGVRGVAHLGVIQCLLDHHYKINAIAGSSAGGLFGAIVAAGLPPNEAAAIVDRFFKSSAFKTNLSFQSRSLLSTAGLENILEPHLRGKNIEDLPIRFAATAVSLRDGEEIVFDRGEIMKAVLATIAIPGVFPSRGDEILVDGSVIDPIPIEPARALEPTLPLVAVVLHRRPPQFQLVETKLPLEDSFFEPLASAVSRSRMGELLRNLTITLDVLNTQMSTMKVQLSKPDVVVEPVVGHVGILQKIESKELFDEGYRSMQEALPQLEKAYSIKNSFYRITRYSRKQKAT